MLYCELSLKIINDFEIVEHGKTAFWFILTEAGTFWCRIRGSSVGVIVPPPVAPIPLIASRFQ